MRRMRILLLLLLAASSLLVARGALHTSYDDETSFTFVEYNVENLFDCDDDEGKEDEEFLPTGTRHWTPKRYWNKQNNTARAILSCGEREDGSAVLPDMIALCEVENDTVLRDLTQRSILRNARYNYIMTDSPDLRGVDVALLYLPTSFLPLVHYPIRITPLPGMRPTRDILYVKGMLSSGDSIHVFTVHAPSRSGGERQTRENRTVVVQKIIESIDSIRSGEPCAKIIIAGDFNDYTSDKNIRMLTANGQVTDISANAVGKNGAGGTYKYHGEWESLDHIFVTEGLLGNLIDCNVNDKQFLLTDDSSNGTVKPKRNYEGFKWADGFSDHLPLVSTFRFKIPQK